MDHLDNHHVNISIDIDDLSLWDSHVVSLVYMSYDKHLYISSRYLIPQLITITASFHKEKKHNIFQSLRL